MEDREKYGTKKAKESLDFNSFSPLFMVSLSYRFSEKMQLKSWTRRWMENRIFGFKTLMTYHKMYEKYEYYSKKIKGAIETASLSLRLTRHPQTPMIRIKPRRNEVNNEKVLFGIYFACYCIYVFRL